MFPRLSEELKMVHAAIAGLKRGSWGVFFLITAAYSALYALSGALEVTPYNAHVYLAKALLQGQFYVDGVPAFMEKTTHAGHVYVAYGLTPALLMLPLVAVWGLAVHQALFFAMLGGAAVALWHATLGKLGVDTERRWVLTHVLGAGSLFWFYAGEGGRTWWIMHVAVVFFLLLAIYDCVGRQRAWVAGLAFGLAVLSRQSVFLALPFFVFLLWRDDRAAGGPSIWGKAWRFALPLGLLLAFNAYYNYARFGSLMDNGYARVISETDQLPYGFFHLHYLAENVKTYLYAAPKALVQFPWFDPTMGGFSIFITTPALLLAFFADWRQRLNQLALVALLPIWAFYLVYYWSGYAQFGCRYSLDFLPFALLLIASAARKQGLMTLKLLLLGGVVVQVWGIFWWNMKGC